MGIIFPIHNAFGYRMAILTLDRETTLSVSRTVVSNYHFMTIALFWSAILLIAALNARDICMRSVHSIGLEGQLRARRVIGDSFYRSSCLSCWQLLPLARTLGESAGGIGGRTALMLLNEY